MSSDVVVLGVKPYVIPEIAEELAEPLAEAEPLVVSLAAGVTLERLESLLPDGARVVRVMPNVAAAVGESMTALAAGTEASEEDLATARELMDAVGRTAVIAEKDFSAFIGLAGSSPALVCAFIDALARAGVMGGIARLLKPSAGQVISRVSPDAAVRHCPLMCKVVIGGSLSVAWVGTDRNARFSSV